MPLIQLRAGRCDRRGNTNWVDPQPGKGLVSLEQSNDDGLLHFQYRDLESNSIVDDLILFPGDATFTKCNSAGGGDASRVYVLKFTSSSARHFYWLQDVSSDNDNRLTSRLNALIDDPDAPDNEDSNMQTEETTSSSQANQPTPNRTSSSTSSNQQPSSSSSNTNQRALQGLDLPGVTSDQMAQFQALLAQSAGSTAGGGGGGGGGMSSLMPSVSLADILAPARLISLLDSNPSLAEALYPYLPSDSKTVPHDIETLKRVLRSPEVRKSARSLDQALTTGALGPLSASLGLTEEETFGVENYLKGVQRLADEDKKKQGGSSGDSMDTT